MEAAGPAGRCAGGSSSTTSMAQRDHSSSTTGAVDTTISSPDSQPTSSLAHWLVLTARSMAVYSQQVMMLMAARLLDLSAQRGCRQGLELLDGTVASATPAHAALVLETAASFVSAAMSKAARSHHHSSSSSSSFGAVAVSAELLLMGCWS